VRANPADQKQDKFRAKFQCTNQLQFACGIRQRYHYTGGWYVGVGSGSQQRQEKQHPWQPVHPDLRRGNMKRKTYPIRVDQPPQGFIAIRTGCGTVLSRSARQPAARVSETPPALWEPDLEN